MKEKNTGKNWVSYSREYKNIVGDVSKEKANTAIRMRREGKTVRDIAFEMGLSISRIYEYLRNDDEK